MMMRRISSAEKKFDPGAAGSAPDLLKERKKTMKDIKLVKPVIVRASLKDMCPVCREQAEKFLDGKEVINNNGEIVPAEKMDKDSIMGSEAAALLREALELQDVSIKTIPVNTIIAEIDDIYQMIDILLLIKRVEYTNDLLGEAIRDGAKPAKVNKVYRLLQEKVEYLLDNDWCGEPLVIEFSDGTRRLYTSLKDVGFGVGASICRM